MENDNRLEIKQASLAEKLEIFLNSNLSVNVQKSSVSVAPGMDIDSVIIAHSFILSRDNFSKLASKAYFSGIPKVLILENVEESSMNFSFCVGYEHLLDLTLEQVSIYFTTNNDISIGLKKFFKYLNSKEKDIKLVDFLKTTKTERWKRLNKNNRQEILDFLASYDVNVEEFKPVKQHKNSIFKH